MQDRVFFSGPDVSVSLTEFVVRGRTYAMSEIASARSARTNPNHIVPVFTALPGFFLLFSGSTAGFGAAILLFVVAGVFWVTHRPEYLVILTSSSAETQALASKDGRYIEQLVQALNDGIAASHDSRGHAPGRPRAATGTPSSSGTAAAASGRANR